MKAIVVKEIGHFTCANVTDPEPGPGEALIKVEIAGMCRTDLKIIRLGHRDLVLPRIPGEEVVGRIVRLNSDERDKNHSFRVDDLVYIYPGIWCGDCPACRKGAENLCRQMQIMGFHRDGGFAEYVTVPIQSLIAVPEGLEADLAVFAEPLSCCLNALELAQVQPGDHVGIWGAGPAGTLLARASQALGGNSLNIDPDPRRRERIGGIEKPKKDERFDVCVGAVGDSSAYVEAIEHLNPRGRLVVFSGLSPDEASQPVDLNQLHYHEQTLVGAYGCSYRHGVTALEMLADGRVPVNDLITHRLPLDRLDKALDLVANRSGLKILLYPKG